MAGEVTRDGQVIPPLNITNPAPVLDLKGFRWRGLEPEVTITAHDEQPSNEPLPKEPHPQAQAVITAGAKISRREAEAVPLTAPLEDTLAPPVLFPIEKFQGSFAGNGFNMIFRPAFTNQDKPAAGDNILELNLTTEQWTFQAIEGDIPNRGFLKQRSVNLGGISYVQTVQDVTDSKTEKAPTCSASPYISNPASSLLSPRPTTSRPVSCAWHPSPTAQPSTHRA